jgi:hypothetical protein
MCEPKSRAPLPERAAIDGVAARRANHTSRSGWLAARRSGGTERRRLARVCRFYAAEMCRRRAWILPVGSRTVAGEYRGGRARSTCEILSVLVASLMATVRLSSRLVAQDIFHLWCGTIRREILSTVLYIYRRVDDTQSQAHESDTRRGGGPNNARARCIF